MEMPYRPGDDLRKAQDRGWISYKGRFYKLGRAFKGQTVALRATDEEETRDVYFMNSKIATLNLRDDAP